MSKILIVVGILVDEASDMPNRKLEIEIEKALKSGEAAIPWLNPRKIEKVTVLDVPK